MTNVLTSTADVTSGSPNVVWHGAPLNSSNCPADSIVTLSGASYFVASLTDTTHFVLTRNFVGSTATGVVSEIYPYADETVGKLNQRTAVLLGEIEAIDANGRGLFFYYAGTSGAVDPGVGNLCLNAAPGSATALYVSETDANGWSVDGLLDLIGGGSTIILRSVATTAYVAYTIGAPPTDAGAYRSATLTYLDGDGALAVDEAISLSYGSVVVNTTGLPVGGTTGQVLTKASGADYDGGWADTALPPSNSITTAMIVAKNVTNAKLADMTAKTFKGRHTNSTGTPEDVSAANLLADIAALPLAGGSLTGLLTTNGQLAFPATPNPSVDPNTLDEYQEGSFTPTIVGQTTAGTGTYSVQAGHYIQIGARVFFDIELVWSAHTGTGSIKVGGLPVAAGARNSAVALSYSNLTFAAALNGYVESGGSTIALGTSATGAAFTALPIDTAATLRVSGSYSVI